MYPILELVCSIIYRFEEKKMTNPFRKYAFGIEMSNTIALLTLTTASKHKMQRNQTFFFKASSMT